MVASSRVITIAFSVAVGCFIGSQSVLFLSHHASISQPISSELYLTAPRIAPYNDQKSIANRNIPVANGSEDPTVFRLHEHVRVSENLNLYRKIIYPLVRKLVESGVVESCPSDEQVRPYLDILKNIEENPSFYEDNSIQNNSQTCPVVFIFYFEGGLKLAESFFKYYSNFETKRCFRFVVPKRWQDHPETQEIIDTHGYTVMWADNKNSTNLQGLTLINGLKVCKRLYGERVVVSMNDLDHFLVWFDLEGQPHRYSSYTDIVRLYVYEFLTTKGCPDDKNVDEKYVVPCTCLMKENKVYKNAIENDGVLWSQYRSTNVFHPTANFYLNETLVYKALRSKTSTVFSNLRNMTTGNIVVHHKIGRSTKKVLDKSKMCGVIHARTENMIQSMAKYHHFLQQATLAQDKKHYTLRDHESTVGDAMACSVADTKEVLNKIRICRKVKELASILGIGHQKLACLNAGYSEEHCSSDMSCCLMD